MKNIYQWAVLSGLGVFLAVSGAQAQEDVFYTSGMVMGINVNSVTIVEGFEDEEEVSAKYMINDETIMENFDSIDEVAEGDLLMVDFYESEKGNIAMNLVRVTEEDLQDFIDDNPDMLDGTDEYDDEYEDVSYDNEDFLDDEQLDLKTIPEDVSDEL